MKKLVRTETPLGIVLTETDATLFDVANPNVAVTDAEALFLRVGLYVLITAILTR